MPSIIVLLAIFLCLCRCYAFLGPAAGSAAFQRPSLPLKTPSLSATASSSSSAAAATKVLVVGAGVGGLATAARLAKAGCKVHVVEKNPKECVGGRVNELFLGPGGKWRFDTGPTLMLLPEVYKDTFRDLGEDPDAFFKLKEVAPTYKAYFSDRTTITLTKDQAKMEAQLEQIQQGSYALYKDYLDYCQLQLDVGLPNFIEERLELKRMPEFALAALTRSPLQSHHKQLQARGFCPKLQALLSFQDLYVGLTPYEAPAVFGLLQAIELNEGIFYPEGGFHGVMRGLQTICVKLGVEFSFDAPVAGVVMEQQEGGQQAKAAGVKLASGQVLTADVVLSNADLPYMERELLPEGKGRDFDKADFSTGVIAFYWATDRKWPQLEHHSIFLSTNFAESWEGAFPRSNKAQDDNEGPVQWGGESVNFYVACPARTDPTAAPPDGDSVMVLVPCPPLRAAHASAAEREQEDATVRDWVERAREEVLSRFEADAGMASFRESILQEEVYSPTEWRERYNLERGAVFGLSHGLNQLSIFRPGFGHPKVPNLFSIGASTRPGNGVPLVLIGSRLCAHKILESIPATH